MIFEKSVMCDAKRGLKVLVLSVFQKQPQNLSDLPTFLIFQRIHFFLCFLGKIKGSI